MFQALARCPPDGGLCFIYNFIAGTRPGTSNKGASAAPGAQGVSCGQPPLPGKREFVPYRTHGKKPHNRGHLSFLGRGNQHNRRIRLYQIYSSLFVSSSDGLPYKELDAEGAAQGRNTERAEIKNNCHTSMQNAQSGPFPGMDRFFATILTHHGRRNGRRKTGKGLRPAREGGRMSPPGRGILPVPRGRRTAPCPPCVPLHAPYRGLQSLPQ